MTNCAPTAAHRQRSHADRMSDHLTHVELIMYERTIENWKPCGDYRQERNLDRRRRTINVRDGTIFALVRWTSNDFRTSCVPPARPVHGDEPMAVPVI
jgi:hypothetical protein